MENTTTGIAANVTPRPISSSSSSSEESHRSLSARIPLTRARRASRQVEGVTVRIGHRR